jgi:hypothetical protein
MLYEFKNLINFSRQKNNRIIIRFKILEMLEEIHLKLEFKKELVDSEVIAIP